MVTCARRSTAHALLGLVVFISVILSVIFISPASGALRRGASGQSIRVGPGPEGICVSSNTKKKYVACRADNTVAVIGPSDTKIETIPVGSAPRSVAANDPLGKVYVSNQDDNTVSVINVSADSVIKTIGVGASPLGLCVNQATSKVYVVDSDENKISVINCLTDTVVKTIGVGEEPVYAAVNERSNRVFVTNLLSNSITVIDGSTDTVKGIVKVGKYPCGIAVSENSNKVYVANAGDDTITVVDGNTSAVGPRIWMEKNSGPFQVCVDSATGLVYVSLSNFGKVAVIDGASDTLRTELFAGRCPLGIAADATARKVYVSDSYSTTVDVFSSSTMQSYYFAEGTTRPNFDPYICVQNTGTEEADVKITYMLGDSTEKEQDIRIAPLSRATAHPADVLGSADDPSHDFSCKVECTNGQRILAERPMYFNYRGAWSGGHDVIGATGSNYHAYFAEGTTRDGFQLYLCIQNPNDQGTFVNAQFGPDISKEVLMAPHSRTTISCCDDVSPGTDFRIDVEAVWSRGVARQPVIAERPIYFDYNGRTGGSDIVGTASPSTIYYFAEGTTRPDFDSFLCISAPRQPAQIKLTFMLGDGTTRVHEFTASARTTINCRDILGTGGDPSHDFSVKVQSTNGIPIVAERPMYFNYRGAWSGGHDVMGTPSPSSTFYFAEGTTRPNFHTYFCIQNPEDQQADVSITYMKGDGTAQEQTLQVSPHSRTTVACHDLLGQADDPSHDFSAKVECTNGGDIVVERPMYFNYHGWTGGHDMVGYQE